MITIPKKPDWLEKQPDEEKLNNPGMLIFRQVIIPANSAGRDELVHVTVIKIECSRNERTS